MSNLVRSYIYMYSIYTCHALLQLLRGYSYKIHININCFILELSTNIVNCFHGQPLTFSRLLFLIQVSGNYVIQHVYELGLYILLGIVFIHYEGIHIYSS